MGFFKDLRADISQAVNELLPDDDFFGLEEENTGENDFLQLEKERVVTEGRSSEESADTLLMGGEAEVVEDKAEDVAGENVQEDILAALAHLGEDMMAGAESDVSEAETVEEVVDKQEQSVVIEDYLEEALTSEQELFAENGMEISLEEDDSTEEAEISLEEDDSTEEEEVSLEEDDSTEEVGISLEEDDSTGEAEISLEEDKSTEEMDLAIKVWNEFEEEDSTDSVQDEAISENLNFQEDELIEDQVTDELPSVEFTEEGESLEFLKSEVAEDIEQTNQLDFEEDILEETDVEFEEEDLGVETMELEADNDLEHSMDLQEVKPEENVELFSENVVNTEEELLLAAMQETGALDTNADEETVTEDSEGVSTTEDFAALQEDEENMSIGDKMEISEPMIEENIIEKEASIMENNLENVQATDQVTVITKGTVINGSISSDGGLEVNGTITGDVECLGKLIVNGNVSGRLKAAEVVVSTPRLDGGIESQGDVKVGVGTIVIGDVTAKSATISGAVKGEIDVQGPVIVDSTAIVKGNITAKSVQINNGAVVDGYCKLAYAEVDIDNFFDGE